VISRSSITTAFPVKKLGEVVEFLDSQRRPVTESERTEGPYPYYGANGKQGTIDDYLFDEPLVLLAEDGGHFWEPQRGIAYRISGKTWVNNHAHVLRARSEIDTGYLCRILENYDVTPFVTGTTRGKLTKAGASEIPIPLPPLAEQKRIAEILDKAEELRSKRRAALSQLDSLTQSIFLEMFGDPRVDGTRWSVVQLEQIVRETKLGLVRGSQEFGHDYPIPYVRMNAITRRGELNLADVQRTHATQVEVDACRLEPGDFLFNTRNSEELVGKTALYRGDGVYLFNNNLMRIRFTDDADAEYVAAAFRTASVQHELNLRKSGTTNVFAIYYKDLKTLPLPLPPISSQRQFAQRVAAVEKLKATQRASLTELDTLFAALQYRAFSGSL
jgi:type I restriction enzyme S subunit